VCCCIVGVAAVLLGHEGSGGVRLKAGSNNQHVVGGVVCQGAGVHGISHGRNRKWCPLHQQKHRGSSLCKRTDVVLQRQGGACGDKGDDKGGHNGSKDVLAVMRAGIGQHNESGREEKEGGHCNDGNCNVIA
jgi:hypothetical protein